MNNRMFAFGLVVIGLFVLGSVGANSCEISSGTNFKIISAIWGNSTHLISAGPGMSDVPLTITLESYGNTCPMYNVQGSLQLYGGVTNYDGSNVASAYTQTVNAGQIFPLNFNLNIANNISAGPNTQLSYPLYVYWNYTNETLRTSSEISVNIPLQGSGQPVYNVGNHALPTGTLENLTMTVSNPGTGTISNIATTLSSSSGLSVIEQPQDVNSLGPNQAENISALVYASSSTTSGPLTLDLNTHYISPYNYNITLASTIGLYTLASAAPTVDISLSNETLLAGIVQKDNLVVTNTGPYAIQNASAELSTAGSLSIIGSDGFVTVPNVAPGSSVSVPITLYDTSSSSTVENLGVDLSYVTDGASYSVSRTLTLLTPGYINLTQVSTTILPAKPTTGSIFSITTTLQNGGSVAASSATATTVAPNGLTVVGASSTYLGSIPTGTPTAYTISFTVSPTAKTGQYKIPVTISYLNNINQKINVSYEYAVNVSSGGILSGASGVATRGNLSSGTYYTRTGGSGILGDIIIIIVIAAIGGGGYWYYKKRIQKKAAKEQHHKEVKTK